MKALRWFLLGALCWACCAEGKVPAGGAYVGAVRNCAMHELVVAPLPALSHQQRFVVMAHWTRYTLALGAQHLRYPMWVAQAHVLRRGCRPVAAKQRAAFVSQLLGMPRPVHQGRWHVVTVRVPVEQAQILPNLTVGPGLLRPCVSGAGIYTDHCSYAAPRNKRYAAWVLAYSLKQYRSVNGYPWTGLGYTYNWRPGAPGVVGVPEWVVGRGTLVTVLAAQSVQQFCGQSHGQGAGSLK